MLEKRKKKGLFVGKQFFGVEVPACDARRALPGTVTPKNGVTGVPHYLFWISGVNNSFQLIAFANITNIWSCREYQYQSTKRTAVVFECVQQKLSMISD